jgi:hypothetical protein
MHSHINLSGVAINMEGDRSADAQKIIQAPHLECSALISISFRGTRTDDKTNFRFMSFISSVEHHLFLSFLLLLRGERQISISEQQSKSLSRRSLRD